MFGVRRAHFAVRHVYRKLRKAFNSGGSVTGMAGAIWHQRLFKAMAPIPRALSVAPAAFEVPASQGVKHRQCMPDPVGMLYAFALLLIFLLGRFVQPKIGEHFYWLERHAHILLPLSKPVGFDY